MVSDGRMPRPHVANGRRIWDADEIAAAFRGLPRDLPAGAAPAHDEDAPDQRETVKA
ncbi:MAG: hypothetical protein WBW81_08160 [Methylocella sp.]